MAEVTETKAKYLMLQAHNENWGSTGPGDWSDIIWRVYSDGSYSLVSEFVPGDEPEEPVRRAGKMGVSSFRKLTEAISCEWDRDLPDAGGCDGDAWAIEQYGENGDVIRSSGPLNYVFRNVKIKRIIASLPQRDCAYDKYLDPNPYRLSREGYHAERRIRKNKSSTKCVIKQTFTLTPFAMDMEREKFLIFMLSREEELSVFLWVYFDEENESERIRITGVNDLMKYTKSTAKAMDVSGKYPNGTLNKALSILTAHPYGELWKMYEEMIDNMDHIGGAERWKQIELDLLDIAEEAKHEHNGKMYIY